MENGRSKSNQASCSSAHFVFYKYYNIGKYTWSIRKQWYADRVRLYHPGYNLKTKLANLTEV